MTSESRSPSPGRADTGASDDKPRLTEKEKKANHIASEQKRRQAIRAGFDRLSNLVPGLEGQARSEGIVLRETVKFITKQLEERERLVGELQAKGVKVHDKDRMALLQLEAFRIRQKEKETEADGGEADGSQAGSSQAGGSQSD